MPGVAGPPIDLDQAVIAAAAADGALGADVFGDEFKHRARVIVKAADDPAVDLCNAGQASSRLAAEAVEMGLAIRAEVVELSRARSASLAWQRSSLQSMMRRGFFSKRSWQLAHSVGQVRPQVVLQDLLVAGRGRPGSRCC